MVFISKKDQKRKQRVAKKIFRETGKRVGFAASVPIPGRTKRTFGKRTIVGPAKPTPTFNGERLSVPFGSTTTERRANIAESSSSRRKAEQSKKDRFCKIVVKKGKRVRVCKVRTPKKKTKTKARSKPQQNNLFGKSFFG